jgi:hypothetical protein
VSNGLAPTPKKAGKQRAAAGRISPDNAAIPVWLHATESFYKKLNRIAKLCELSRYEALSRGLDALFEKRRFDNRP